MDERTRILILGYGEMGQAMAHLLQSRHEIHVWQRRAASPVQLEALAASANLIFFCIPTEPHLALARRLQPALTGDAVCVSVAKGLDDQGRTAQQVLREALPTHATAVMHGPMIAEALRAGRHGFAQVGTTLLSVFMRVQGAFAHTPLFLQHSTDPIGLGWAAALKNVYAIACGAADEWALGENVRGFLIAQAVAEIADIVALLGGARESAYGWAGLGDLVTTATSADSHHHEVGRRLARGDVADIAGEGVHTIACAQSLALFDARPFPLFAYIARGVVERRLTREGLSALFAAGR